MATEIYELKIEASVAHEPKLTTLHFSGDGVATNDTVAGAENLLAAWKANLENLWLATLPDSYSIMVVSARRVSVLPSATRKVWYLQGEVPGTRSGTTATQQFSPVVFSVPNMGIKSGNKIFWPAVLTTDCVNNQPAAAWKTVVDNFYATGSVGFTNAGITWKLWIWNRKAFIGSPITGHTFSPLLGFLRRRRRPWGGSSKKPPKLP